MKPFLLLLLLLFTLLLVSAVTESHAQTVFRIDSLPEKGILLDKGWTFHAGDNPAWAKPEFDDTPWDTLNPTQDMALLHQLPQQGIGWFRIRLQIPPLLRGKPIGLFIIQAGAIELFLNGQLVARNGKISPKKQLTRSVASKTLPFISLGTDSVQLLAVRYAFTTERLHFLKQWYPFLHITIMSAELAEEGSVSQVSDTMWETGLFGIFLALGILQLLLYAASTEQRSTLNLGLFLVTQGITHLIAADLLLEPLGITRIALLNDFLGMAFTVSLTISGYCYLLGIYQYFRQPKGGVFFVITSLTLATIPLALFIPQAANLVWFILGIFVPWAEVLRVGFIALKQKKSGAKLFTIAHGILVAVFIVYTLTTFIPSFRNFLGEYGSNLFLFSFLGLALTVSLLLSHERATANKLLRQQLIDLESLSQKTIAQEQEKQQLLATQNERLEQQVTERTAELKASQAQLIQKEKLASLGELTAGIAHEIQNPLNFVNNFSEVSAELVSELEEEQQKPDRDTELEAELLGDLKQNLQKITHHGGRASAIVKGMLEHSRSSTGERQSTDLNALADEYLRLAYHGLRAKDKDFNVELVTDFDAALPNVPVVAQDIGRVLLNLYNNAFYAVREKQKTAPADYQTTITVSTERVDNRLEIRVQDNGTGIPDAMKARIFQPFFTTKPTGEGTGLGLSLSYDIVTKGHGGTLTVESEEGEGTTFVIDLPA